MTVALLWWLLTTLLGWAAWPWARLLFAHAPGRGWAAGRLLGLVLAAYLYWLTSSMGLFPAGRALAIAVCAACLVAGSAAWWRLLRSAPHALRAMRREILTVELLFAGSLALYLFFRGGTPAIRHTEGPMDLAMLSATLRSTSMPPADPWLAGESVSYYYGGYLLVGLLARVTATPAPTAYNLGLGLYAAFTAIGTYGALHAMLSPRGISRKGRAFAILGALFTVGCSNGEPLLEFLHARLGIATLARWSGVPGLAEAPVTGRWLPEGIWWWRASRIATDISLGGRSGTLITEFPAFGFLLGDLHPHLMGLPFLALGVAVAIELLARSRQGGRPHAALALAVLPLGYAGMVNTWDLPVIIALIGVAWGLGRWAYTRRPWRSLLETALVSVVGLGLCGLLYAPFYAQLESQIQGLGFVILTRTRLRSLILQFGLWYLPITLELLLAPRPTKRSWRRVAWLSLSVALAPWLAVLILGGVGVWGLALVGALSAGPWVALLLSILVGMLIEDLWARIVADGSDGSLTQLSGHLLALLASLALIGLEFIFIRDLFGTRMNTVFKVYQQAWILLAASAGCAAYHLCQAQRPRRWALIPVALLLALSLPYLPLAAAGRWAESPSAWTLDGAAYLADEDPDTYAAYRWLLANGQADDVLVEAPGETYDPATSRLSALTGMPTILGWPGHVVQWRGHSAMLAPRLEDLEVVYVSGGESEVVETLARYNARYLYVGACERDRYGLDERRLAQLFGWLEPAMSSGDVHILRVASVD